MRHTILGQSKGKCDKCGQSASPIHSVTNKNGIGSRFYCQRCCPICGSGKSEGMDFKSAGAKGEVCYFRVKDSMIPLEQRTQAYDFAIKFCDSEGISVPKIKWFVRGEDDQCADEYEGFQAPPCNGFYSLAEPDVIWLRQDLKGADLAEVTVHEILHSVFGHYASESEVDSMGKAWSRNNSPTPAVYKMDHRPQPWERPPEAKCLKFGDILETPHGKFKNYSGDINGALWSEIIN